MTVDHVFPEDQGTGASEGDDADAANFAAHSQHDNNSDYKASGLGLTVDYSVPDFDTASGKCFIKDRSATTAQSGETRDHGVLYEVEVTSRTGVALTDGAVNEVFIDIDLTADDSVSVVVTSDGSTPASPYLKIAEVDTSADTKDESFNAEPSGAFEDINFPILAGSPSFSSHDHAEGGLTTIPNSGLSNAQVTVNGGIGLTGAGAIALGGSGSLDFAPEDDEEIPYGAGDDVTERYDSTNDDFRWQDNTNTADRMALDRTTGDLSISGSLTEGATL